MSKDEENNPLIMVNPNGTAPLLTGLSGTSGFYMPSQSSYAHTHDHTLGTSRIEELEEEVKALTARLNEFEKQWGWMLKEADDVRGGDKGV